MPDEIDCTEVIECMGELKQVVKDLEDVVYGTREGKVGIETIIYGSEDLKVEPIRETLDRIATAYDRVVWLLGILGISSVAGLIGWILFLLNRSPTP